jgi:hypothetical protein
MLGARSRLVAAVAVSIVAVLSAAPSQAVGERPSAYINPDIGMPTENPGVAASSECETPVQSDTMALGDEVSGMGNVHIDACLFSGDQRVDTKATFEVSGVGVVSACPDSDKEGPKTATKIGNACLHDGFEAANSEYHVRVVSATAGVQTVRFCADPESNGCVDAESVSTVQITWGAPQGGVAAGGTTPAGPPGPGAGGLGLGAAGLVALAGALVAAGALGLARARS